MFNAQVPDLAALETLRILLLLAMWGPVVLAVLIGLLWYSRPKGER